MKIIIKHKNKSFNGIENKIRFKNGECVCKISEETTLNMLLSLGYEVEIIERNDE